MFLQKNKKHFLYIRKKTTLPKQKMENINQYITLTIEKTATVTESYSKIELNNNVLQIFFFLNSNSCLFNLPNNYTIYIEIQNQYFDKYYQNIEFNFNAQPICCNTQSKLFDIITCKITGLFRKIYMESAILFILYQTQKDFNIANAILPNCENCSFLNKPLEVDKIQKAKDYILNNLSENITIPVIAAAVATNQCYLKKGFKEIFGKTIFDFIQENRMVKAQYLLNNNPQYSVAQVAYSVGYSSISSFSKAYKNYFGINPSIFSKHFLPTE